MKNRVALFLLCLCFPLLAEAAAVATVADFSPLPMGKSFIIKHADGSQEKLEYAETRLQQGDQLLFPKGDFSKKWVKVRFNDKEATELTVRQTDSPWLAKSRSGGGLANDSASKLSSLYASIFRAEKKARYTQGMSRGDAKVLPMTFPMTVKNKILLVSDSQSDVSIFWHDGIPPFRIESPGEATIILKAPEKEWLYGHAVYQHTIALNRQNCLQHNVSYSLSDSTGLKVDFMITCFESDSKPSIDDMTLNLDTLKTNDGAHVSQRLLLWNRLKELPASSSKRMSLKWLLLTGSELD
ncbi:hypothetical protein [Mariprofundus sp. KV]|uniref:hypothetical protein n=1 Tax=Mariprofundus sp. KV TaxID=2608715 RepID=UPI0015A26B97|nr:hypothetical protein [Mariprofundus sp. KV]NWF35145.1 hypothetical protein [Mariprofundus sp. KV]